MARPTVLILVATYLNGCGGQFALSSLPGQLPGVLNIPVSVCVATITQDMQSLGQLKAAMLGTAPPVAP